MKLKLILIFTLLLSLKLSAQNQNKLIADFGDGTYTAYKVTEGKNPSFEKVSKQWPVKITKGSGKDAQGNDIIEMVTVSRMGILNDEMKPDIKENPVYFNLTDNRITVKDGLMFYYTWSNDNANIKYVLAKNGSPGGYSSEKSGLEAFVRAGFANQQATRGEIKAKQAEIAKADAAKNTIKDKKIQSLEIVTTEVPAAMGMQSIVKFGIKAIGADGAEYKTPNIGGKTPWDDFEVTSKEGIFSDEAITVKDDGTQLLSGELTFTVASKANPSVKTTKSILLNFNFPNWYINVNGLWGMEVKVRPNYAMNGLDASSLDIKVVKAKLKSGDEVYKVEATDKAHIRPTYKFMVSTSTVLTISALGGNGQKGRDTKTDRNPTKAGDGSNGGNGGNITITKDPSAADFNITVNNTGGPGGDAGVGYSSLYHGNRGRDGNSGKTDVQVKPVKLSW